MLAFDIENQQVFTDSFDGPLELLLYLVRRQGVDIRTVRISSITDSYLDHVRKISELRLDVAGDFLFLASTLCYLKSRELLPNAATEKFEDEEENPMLIRERLARQLIEYERYREASHSLEKRNILNRDVFKKPSTIEQSQFVATTHIDALSLVQLYKDILDKYMEPSPELHLTRATFSLREMGEWILNKLELGSSKFSEMTRSFPLKEERIVCFLTILELARHQIIDLFQIDHLSEISINHRYEQRPSLDFLFEKASTDE
jgi:segregation and condensation protein A